jgi:hypothetical protein
LAFTHLLFVQLQLGASLQALLEVQRLQAESQAKRQEVASLEASRDAQAAALAELARQRDEEATRRYFRSHRKVLMIMGALNMQCCLSGHVWPSPALH